MVLLYSEHSRATGFIGFSVSQALVRAGHDVYGITRSIEKSRKLATEESTVTFP